MKVCYIDESGDTSDLLSSMSPVQPVLAIVGVTFDQKDIASITHRFIKAKSRFAPVAAQSQKHRLDMLLHEVKGADLRKQMITGSKRRARPAMLFFDDVLQLLEDYRAKIFGRVWIKKIGAPCKGTAIFAFSIQSICETLQRYLTDADCRAIVVADSRSPGQNVKVSHAILTQKFKASGDSFDRILEMPMFGHSNNHAGLQIADVLSSAFFFPVATNAYCHGHVTSVHVRPEYKKIRDEFGPRIKALQFRYQKQWGGKMLGGITVCDLIGRKSGAHLFADCSLPILPASVAASVAPTEIEQNP